MEDTTEYIEGGAYEKKPCKPGQSRNRKTQRCRKSRPACKSGKIRTSSKPHCHYPRGHTRSRSQKRKSMSPRVVKSTKPCGEGKRRSPVTHRCKTIKSPSGSKGKGTGAGRVAGKPPTNRGPKRAELSLGGGFVEGGEALPGDRLNLSGSLSDDTAAAQDALPGYSGLNQDEHKAVQRFIAGNIDGLEGDDLETALNASEAFQYARRAYASLWIIRDRIRHGQADKREVFTVEAAKQDLAAVAADNRAVAERVQSLKAETDKINAEIEKFYGALVPFNERTNAVQKAHEKFASDTALMEKQLAYKLIKIGTDITVGTDKAAVAERKKERKIEEKNSREEEKEKKREEKEAASRAATPATPAAGSPGSRATTLPDSSPHSVTSVSR